MKMKRLNEWLVNVPRGLRKLWGGVRQVRFVSYWDAKRKYTVTRAYKVRDKA